MRRILHLLFGLGSHSREDEIKGLQRVIAYRRERGDSEAETRKLEALCMQLRG